MLDLSDQTTHYNTNKTGQLPLLSMLSSVSCPILILRQSLATPSPAANLAFPSDATDRVEDAQALSRPSLQLTLSRCHHVAWGIHTGIQTFRKDCIADLLECAPSSSDSCGRRMRGLINSSDSCRAGAEGECLRRGSLLIAPWD